MMLLSKLTNAMGHLSGMMIGAGIGSSIMDHQRVDCAKWEFASDGREKFKWKHLLDGMNLTEEEVLGANRTEINQHLQTLLNNPIRANTTQFLKFPTTYRPQSGDIGYGNETRVTIILQTANEFLKKYISTRAQIMNQLQTGLAKNGHYHRHLPSLAHTSDMIWHPDRCNVLNAVWNRNANTYDIYIIDDTFVICGTVGGAHTSASGRSPIHLENLVMSRQGETTAADLVAGGIPKRNLLQQRSHRAESWGRFMMDSVCIAKGQ